MTKDEVERADVLITTHCKVSRLKRHATCAENGGRPWCGLDIPPERVDPDWSRVTCELCWAAKRYLSNHPCLACWPIVVWVVGGVLRTLQVPAGAVDCGPGRTPNPAGRVPELARPAARAPGRLPDRRAPRRGLRRRPRRPRPQAAPELRPRLRRTHGRSPSDQFIRLKSTQAP